MVHFDDTIITTDCMSCLLIVSTGTSLSQPATDPGGRHFAGFLLLEYRNMTCYCWFLWLPQQPQHQAALMLCPWGYAQCAATVQQRTLFKFLECRQHDVQHWCQCSRPPTGPVAELQDRDPTCTQILIPKTCATITNTAQCPLSGKISVIIKWLPSTIINTRTSLGLLYRHLACTHPACMHSATQLAYSIQCCAVNDNSSLIISGWPCWFSILLLSAIFGILLLHHTVRSHIWHICLSAGNYSVWCVYVCVC